MRKEFLKKTKKASLHLLLKNGLAFFFFFLFFGNMIAFAALDEKTIAPFKEQSVVTGSEADAYKFVENVIVSIVNYIYMAFGAAAILFILLAAYNFLSGGTNEDKLRKAKSQLKYAVIAIVVALISGGVSLIIGSFLEKAGS
ncbi:MAG: hypothetical protein N2Z68_02320 [Patescibacteria group bacterium]|nr:hypothetical protein [Patescibacteria group bacterium]